MTAVIALIDWKMRLSRISTTEGFKSYTPTTSWRLWWVSIPLPPAWQAGALPIELQSHISDWLELPSSFLSSCQSSTLVRISPVNCRSLLPRETTGSIWLSCSRLGRGSGTWTHTSLRTLAPQASLSAYSSIPRYKMWLIYVLMESPTTHLWFYLTLDQSIIESRATYWV